MWKCENFLSAEILSPFRPITRCYFITTQLKKFRPSVSFSFSLSTLDLDLEGKVLWTGFVWKKNNLKSNLNPSPPHSITNPHNKHYRGPDPQHSAAMNADEVVADVKSTITEKKRKRLSGSNARRSVKRPEEILRDVRGLKLRQRVSLVLGDEILREELEDSIKNSTVNGVKKIDTIRAYQDILLPALQPNLINIGGGGGGGGGGGR